MDVVTDSQDTHHHKPAKNTSGKGQAAQTKAQHPQGSNKSNKTPGAPERNVKSPVNTPNNKDGESQPPTSANTTPQQTDEQILKQSQTVPPPPSANDGKMEVDSTATPSPVTPASTDSKKRPLEVTDGDNNNKSQYKVLEVKNVKGKQIMVIEVDGKKREVARNRYAYDIILTEDVLKTAVLSQVTSAGKKKGGEGKNNLEAGWKLKIPVFDQPGKTMEMQFQTPIVKIDSAILHGVGVTKKGKANDDASRQFKIKLNPEIDEDVAKEDPSLPVHSKNWVDRMMLLRNHVGNLLWETPSYMGYARDSAWFEVVQDVFKSFSDLVKAKGWAKYTKAVTQAKDMSGLPKEIVDLIQKDSDIKFKEIDDEGKEIGIITPMEKAKDIFIRNMADWHWTGDTDTPADDPEHPMFRASTNVFFVDEDATKKTKGKGGNKQQQQQKNAKVPQKFANKQGGGGGATFGNPKKAAAQQKRDQGIDDDGQDEEEEQLLDDSGANNSTMDTGANNDNNSNDRDDDGDDVDDDGTDAPNTRKKGAVTWEKSDEEVNEIIKRMTENGYRYNKITYKDHLGHEKNLGPYANDNNYRVIYNGDYGQAMMFLWVYSCPGLKRYGFKLYFKPYLWHIREGRRIDSAESTELSTAGRAVPLRDKKSQAAAAQHDAQSNNQAMNED